MRDLEFRVTGVEAAQRSLTPLLQFKLRISSKDPEPILGLLLNVQIQLQPARRPYSAAEQEKLFELFGPPAQWGQTLRNRLWAQATLAVGEFSGEKEALLPIPCTYDLNVASAKYLAALESGEVSLLFLFSGSVFFASPDGHLRVERLSWEKECVFPMPITKWKDLMETHFPHSAWVFLDRDTFERLQQFKRHAQCPTWEAAVEELLERAGAAEAGQETSTDPRPAEAIAEAAA